jgi:adenylate cyclase class IV
VAHPLGTAGAGAPGGGPADEVEVNAVVPDPEALRARLAAAGARLAFAGLMEDRRYDTADAALARRDEVLRLRTARPGPAGHGAARASLDWKGPTRVEGGYKVREEHSTPVGDPAVLVLVLERLGLQVRREVDRDIEEYVLGTGAGAAALRVEHYPRMDVLIEVEGPPDAIERAIVATGIPRAAFGAGRLVDYKLAYERRTGQRAATARREL